MEKQNLTLWQLNVGQSQRFHRENLCRECAGRGWLWTRAYEPCPECFGEGVWKEESPEVPPSTKSAF